MLYTYGQWWDEVGGIMDKGVRKGTHGCEYNVAKYYCHNAIE